MTTSTVTPLQSELFLHVREEIEIDAPLEVAFQAMLEQIGPHFDKPDGEAMPMKLEPWPGGRWFRDLGNNAGHLWGHVQVIKPPTILEIHGPMFMSYAAISHIQYRLAKEGRGTRLTLVHRAMGEIDPEHRTGVVKGWSHIVKRIKERAKR